MPTWIICMNCTLSIDLNIIDFLFKTALIFFGFSIEVYLDFSSKYSPCGFRNVCKKVQKYYPTDNWGVEPQFIANTLHYIYKNRIIFFIPKRSFDLNVTLQWRLCCRLWQGAPWVIGNYILRLRLMIWFVFTFIRLMFVLYQYQSMEASLSKNTDLEAHYTGLLEKCS